MFNINLIQDNIWVKGKRNYTKQSKTLNIEQISIKLTQIKYD